MGYLRGRRNFRGQPAFGFRTNIQRFAARRRTVSLESRALSTPAARAKTRRCQMFKWALIFAVIALIAAVLGFGGVAGAAAGVAKILFFVGLALVVLFLILGSAAASAARDRKSTRLNSSH